MEKGLIAFAEISQEIKKSLIEIMKIHPINSLLVLNLIHNMGYAMLVDPEVKIGTGHPTELAKPFHFGHKRFSDRKDMMAWIFRQNAVNIDELLKAEVIGQLFSTFNFGKLLQSLKGIK